MSKFNEGITKKHQTILHHSFSQGNGTSGMEIQNAKMINSMEIQNAEAIAIFNMVIVLRFLSTSKELRLHLFLYLQMYFQNRNRKRY